jgi:hypothetical protein
VTTDAVIKINSIMHRAHVFIGDFGSCKVKIGGEGI